ncbi:uncharacterized protein [Malus domestica]|uniref:uncharacterized protein n=1 Tax=Malus domestica TaxID=3750 RepID=UPI003976BCFB
MDFFIHLRTAKKVWEEVAQTYYDGFDISQIYELKVKSFRLHQEGRPIGVYYADLKVVWQDQRRPNKMECALDLKTLREEVQLDRVYAFLAGLDDIFDKVCSDTLRTQPLPSVDKVFLVVRQEAQRHATMMGGSAAGNQGRTPPMAIVSQPHSSSWPYGPSSSTDSRPFTRENKDDLKCTFCGKTRHTEDTCFLKHGVPEWFSELKKKLRAKELAANGASGSVHPWPLQQLERKMSCLLKEIQDIQTKEIIEHDTKRKGLYYMDDVVPGRANAVRASRSLVVTLSMVAVQYSSVVKALRTDNGGEYVNSESSNFFRDQGIIHETTCLYTPQQNGVAERKNSHSFETALALLIGGSVPKSFWPDAITYAVYVINCMSSRVVEFCTPLQVLTEHVPVVCTNTLTPQMFGCVSYVHIHKIHHSKLDPCAIRCVFVGFVSYQTGYKCYHPVMVSGGVHGAAMPSNVVDARSPSAKPVASGQQLLTEPATSGLQLLTEEEAASPCVSAAKEECSDGQPTIAEASSPLFSSTVPLSNTYSLDIPEVSTRDTHVPNDVISTYKLPPR